MTDYTPTMAEIMEDWSSVRGQAIDPEAKKRRDDREAMFLRAVAAHDADKRAEWGAERALPDEEPVSAEADRDSEECDGSPHLRGLLLRTIAVSDLNGADSAGPVLGSRTPVVVLAHDASSLDAARTRTTPDRSGERAPVPDTTEEEP